MTDQQVLISELCEREEAKLEQEAIEHYKEENYPAHKGKHSEMSLSEDVIRETKKEE